MCTYSAPGGPPPKPQRRRRNKPASYGAAEPVLTGQGQEQPPLGSTPTSWWSACGRRRAPRLRVSSTRPRIGSGRVWRCGTRASWCVVASRPRASGRRCSAGWMSC